MARFWRVRFREQKPSSIQTAHLSNLEQPRAFTAAVLDFLLAGNANADPFETGIKVRRQVLGDDHVNRSMCGHGFYPRLSGADHPLCVGLSMDAPAASTIARRRLLVLAVTASLGRWEEFRLHLRAALAHGLEACDVKETLLQVAVYAGVPAANTAFQIAKEEMATAGAGTIGQWPSRHLLRRTATQNLVSQIFIKY